MTQLLQHEIGLAALRRRNGLLFDALSEVAPDHPALTSVQQPGVPVHTLIEKLVRACLAGTLDEVATLTDEIREYYDPPAEHWRKGVKLTKEHKAKLRAGKKAVA